MTLISLIKPASFSDPRKGMTNFIVLLLSTWRTKVNRTNCNNAVWHEGWQNVRGNNWRTRGINKRLTSMKNCDWCTARVTQTSIELNGISKIVLMAVAKLSEQPENRLRLDRNGPGPMIFLKLTQLGPYSSIDSGIISAAIKGSVIPGNQQKMAWHGSRTLTTVPL